MKLLSLLFLSFIVTLDSYAFTTQTKNSNSSKIRVPAEWEKHQATWMQWPQEYEAKMRDDFFRIIEVVQKYEAMNILVNSEIEKQEAQNFLMKKGLKEKNITWHIVALDNAWMRDSGPIYVTDGSKIWIQNWGFNGWDKKIDAPYKNDNLVPSEVGKIKNMQVEDYTDYILEKGNLEVNGDGVALLNWDCQKERNPNLSKTEHEEILKKALGLKTIIWAYGYDESDITTGHIDGIARFVSKNRVVVTKFGGTMQTTEDKLIVELKNAGFEVIRYYGDPNWLVGNGFVLGVGDGSADDKLLKQDLEEIWPNHDVYVIDIREITKSGGGIHCVTNDEPSLNILNNSQTSQNSQIFNLKKNWNLVGAVDDILNMNSFNIDCIEGIWSYKSGIWSNYKKNLNTELSISKGSGFWVRSNSDNCVVN